MSVKGYGPSPPTDEELERQFERIGGGTAADGWIYGDKPPANGDARKLVTIECSQQMTWVGIRAYDHNRKCWLNNGEPEKDHIKAWRDLPEPAHGFWSGGILYFTTKAG